MRDELRDEPPLGTQPVHEDTDPDVFAVLDDQGGPEENDPDHRVSGKLFGDDQGVEKDVAHHHLSRDDGHDHPHGDDDYEFDGPREVADNPLFAGFRSHGSGSGEVHAEAEVRAP